MTGKVGVGGAWKDFVQGGFKVGVAGAWKTVAKAWIGVGGAWKEWYVNFVVTLTGQAVTASSAGADSRAGLRFNPNGSAQREDNGVFSALVAPNWVEPPAASSESGWDIFFHVDAGNIDEGDALDTWLALTSARAVRVIDTNPTAVSFESATVTVSIRKDGVTQGSAQYTLEANRDTGL